MKFLIAVSFLCAFHASIATEPLTQPTTTKNSKINTSQKQSKRSLYEDNLDYGYGAPQAAIAPIVEALPVPVPIPSAPIAPLGPLPAINTAGGVYAEAIAVNGGPIPGPYAPGFAGGYAPAYPGPAPVGPIGDPLIQQTVEITRPVPVPVIRTVAVAVPHPVPVPVPQPYFVRVPHPVRHEVPVHITKHIPVPVERLVPVSVPSPYPVKIIKKIPVPDPYPVHVPVYKVKHVYHY